MEVVVFRNLVLGKRIINYICIIFVRRDVIFDFSDIGVIIIVIMGRVCVFCYIRVIFVGVVVFF